MQNVYDAIGEFYRNDPGWENVLPQHAAEGYFRHLAWQGVPDDQMRAQWDQMVMLCIYLENAEKDLGELTGDDLVDAVAWCARNVVDFQATVGQVRSFLDNLGSFFVYLKQEGVVESSLPPYLAKQLLLKDDGTLAIIDEEGRYLPGEEKREEEGAPPSEGRIFLNAGESLNGLMGEIHRFFQKDEFNLDFERAITLYEVAMDKIDLEEDGSETFWRGFWDYFLFDYHLLDKDLTPLHYFQQYGHSVYPQLVEELGQAFTALFTIEEVLDEERSICKDLLTGEDYFLTFPLEEGESLQDKVFMGHIFYNRSMGMNYLQSFPMKPLARKRLLEVLTCCRDWFDVQLPGVDWDEFLERQSLVCRKVLRLTAQNPAGCVFPYKTKQTEYLPPALPEQQDRSMVEKLLERIFLARSLSAYDLELARSLWQDFLKIEPYTGAFAPEIWAAAITENFLEINAMGGAGHKPFYFLESLGIPHGALTQAYLELRTQLKLEPFDPRYLDEMGFLMMFSKKA